jgi:hypothetical protein
MVTKAYQLLEILLSFGGVIFILTTVIMIINLKRAGFDPVGSSVRSKWSIDINLSFFKKLRQGYQELNSSSWLPVVNQISFYVLIIGFVCLFALAIIENLVLV